jgi:hypothetical protein
LELLHHRAVQQARLLLMLITLLWQAVVVAHRL